MKQFVVIVGASVLAGFLFYAVSMGAFSGVFFWTEQVPQIRTLYEDALQNGGLSIEEPEREVSAPLPLRILQPSSSTASLTAQGVFEWTNMHRQETGLSLLSRNALLDQIATAKVQDMFARQYFEHISPSGEGISVVAENLGYDFLSIGENLALGNYESDEVLVQAWMDSPGHRANILGSYSEIGIALMQGEFDGNSTWLAVQVFARPLSECAFPDEQLKVQIELKNEQLEEMGVELEQREAEIKAYRPKMGSAYKQKVEEYNLLVEQYNALAASVKEDVADYNWEVRLFNECANA